MSLWGKLFGLEKNPEYELGIKYFNEGKYEQAVASLEKAIQKVGRSDPTYALGMFYAAESHAHIGAAKFHSGDLEGALLHFDKALEENPTYPDLYYRMGVIHHQLGNVEKAEALLRRAIEYNNSYFEAFCYLGIVLYEKGSKEEADGHFEKALEIGADMPSPISKFLSCHLCGKETDIPPLSQLKKLITADSDFDSCVKEGVEAFNTGNFDRAIQALSEAVRLHPDYADMRFKLGMAYLRNAEHAKAREELERAIEINPNYTEARFYLGIAYLDEKKYNRALGYFERAVEERPGYADLQCFYGATLFHLGDLDRARIALESSIELSPQYRKALYYYGLLLYAQGERERAISYLTEAMNGAENMSAANISLALVHLREGNLEEAMVVLGDIVKAGGESADVLYFIGEVYMKMGDLGAAEDYFKKALEVNPRFLRAKEKLAVIMVRNGNYEKAEEILEPQNEVFADLYKIMGDIKFYKGELDAAEEQYRQSLGVNAEYGGAFLSLALTLRKKGLEDEAEAVLRKLLEIDPEDVVARNLLGRGPLDLDSPSSS